MNIVAYLIQQNKARQFTKSVRNIIKSLHPDCRFRIRHHNVGNGRVELSIDTKDKRAIACFILIQEAMTCDDPTLVAEDDSAQNA